ncbi:hypothetical protein HBB16_10105 [Pseudonocardia sp. MCCB 268]|nr:hypothetical protein [Pseudonocardia cytotoxica]
MTQSSTAPGWPATIFNTLTARGDRVRALHAPGTGHRTRRDRTAAMRSCSCRRDPSPPDVVFLA